MDSLRIILPRDKKTVEIMPERSHVIPPYLIAGTKVVEKDNTFRILLSALIHK